MRLLLPCVLGVVLTLVAPARSTAQAQFSFDYPAIAGRLVQQLRLQPGEKVLIVAIPGLFEDLVPHLRHAVMKAGGVDLGVIDVLREPVPAAWDPLCRSAARRRLAPPTRHAARRGRGHHVAGRRAGAPRYAAMQDWLRDGRGRTVHFHWVENGSALPLPGQPLPRAHVIDALYQRALLETDYAALAGAARVRGGDARRRGARDHAARHGTCSSGSATAR